MNWINVKDRLPEEKEWRYQVLAMAVKVHKDGMYKGSPIKTIVQDWTVRLRPGNFTYWMPLPEPPE